VLSEVNEEDKKPDLDIPIAAAETPMHEGILNNSGAPSPAILGAATSSSIWARLCKNRTGLGWARPRIGSGDKGPNLAIPNAAESDLICARSLRIIGSLAWKGSITGVIRLARLVLTSENEALR
jgi:hypothetical protein